MPLLYLIWNNKRWSLIIALCIMFFCQLFYTNHLSKKLRVASEQCNAKIQVIEQKHLKALAEKQNAINQVSADYEKAKSEQRIKVETVTREVQKIIDRPVYQQFCFDDDGVSAINSLVASDSSEPP